MALTAPSESPAIVVKEVDLTSGVPNIPTSTGAFVGNFSWGPCDIPTLVSNEATLVGTFGSPDTDNTVDFHSASYYLRYSNDLYVVRDYTSVAKNASDTNASSVPLVTNRDNFDGQQAQLTTDTHNFIAKYPGTLGNSLRVSFSGQGDADYDNWPYKSYYDAAPGTSDFATAAGATNDEAHVAVIDEDGAITGTAGTVLETFPFVSIALGAKTSDGTSNYILNVINSRSQYVWLASVPTATFGTNAGSAPASGLDFAAGLTSDFNVSLVGGVNSAALGAADFATGFDKFEDPNALAIDFMIAPGMASAADHATVVNDMIATAQSIRKDCMVIASPNRSAVVGQTTSAAAVSAISSAMTSNAFTRSSYLAVDNNYLKVYDKYNDQYIFIPAASSTAGIMAATDNNFAPWFSPAGTRRGQYFGVTSLAYSPNKSERDTLYKAGINPIANIPGQGILLYGDKTHLARPSAFDRINVRRLFLVLERAIAAAAQNILFEFNDEFTRAEFVNIVEPLLRDVKGRRGITDFKLVCDETNNTPLIIDSNQFIASLFIKPARSINFITLNFVAVRTGVTFEEVVGTSGV
ncbi:MAG: hypothetical protein CMA53_03770 [Euryarchaeota archaeon]|nr:hypothetical protein [Euryarchaeota archaeon]